MDLWAIAGLNLVDLQKTYNKTVKLLQNEHQVFQPNEAHHQTNRVALESPLLHPCYWSPKKQRQLEVGLMISKKNVTL